jgi:hypothetical protein
MQKDDPDFVGFYMYFFGGSTRYDHMIQEIVAQIFDPMARDLRAYLYRRISAVADDLSEAPASDRTVPLTHNSPEYIEAIESLKKLESTVAVTNDYEDFNDKEQRMAELSAGRRLLEAPQVRADALKAVLYKGLLYLAKKFADHAIGIGATATIAAIGRLIGVW